MKNYFFLILFLIGCVPPTVDPQVGGMESYEEEDCDTPCEILTSFAASDYQNQDWRSAINNYNELLNCNCGKKDPENTFKYMAYSYQQLGLYDSAGYIFKQGLRYIPEDIELLKMAGENAGRLKSLDDQIYYFDKILSIEENNVEVLELLSDVYGNQSMFEEQISILNLWLEYEPSNRKASTDKRSAYAALGKDISNVDKERWEAQTSNIDYGLDYIRSLESEGNTQRIIEVCNELLIYDKYNKKVLRYLGDAYQTNYNPKDAVNIYTQLMKVDPTNYMVAIEISKINIDLENFSKALEWAEKSISISGKNGEALFQRAEVYYEIATSCNSNEESLSHWTRAVYEFAWQDYQSASNIGFKQAQSRTKWLEEQGLITQRGTWFQLDKNLIKISDSPLDCYNWIDRNLKKRENL